MGKNYIIKISDKTNSKGQIKLPKTKIIGGKKYKREGGEYNTTSMKSIVQRDKKALEKKGYSARIVNGGKEYSKFVKGENQYGVYYRKK